jgi:hypothetical protein
MLLYQNELEDSAEIVTIMNAFPAGKEDEMLPFLESLLVNKI